MTLNAITDTYFATDPGIVDYSIAPVGTDGWLRVSMVFKTTVGGVATPCVEGNRASLWSLSAGPA